MKKILLIILSVTLTCISSCSKRENNDQTKKILRSKEINEFAETLVKLTNKSKKNTNFFISYRDNQSYSSDISTTSTSRNTLTISELNEINQDEQELRDASIELLETFDLYDELIAEFGNSNTENIISSALVVFIEQNANYPSENTTFQITRGELVSCLAELILFGGTSASMLIWGSAKVAAKAIVGIAAKVASRFLGPIGVAFTIWNLTGCLLEADAN